MTELRDNIYAIEVPNSIRGLIIKRGAIWGKYHPEHSFTRKIADVPPGSYEIMFTTKGVTEQQAATVIENYSAGTGFGAIYRDYYSPYEGGMEKVNLTAQLSLQSLLKSKGLSAGNYLIIKKVSL